MKLLYFAWLREKVGVAEETVELPETVRDVAGLLDWLEARGAGFSDAFRGESVIRVAVNQCHAFAHTSLKADDEVALFPPVTGG